MLLKPPHILCGEKLKLDYKQVITYKCYYYSRNTYVLYFPYRHYCQFLSSLLNQCYTAMQKDSSNLKCINFPAGALLDKGYNLFWNICVKDRKSFTFKKLIIDTKSVKLIKEIYNSKYISRRLNQDLLENFFHITLYVIEGANQINLLTFNNSIIIISYSQNLKEDSDNI